MPPPSTQSGISITAAQLAAIVDGQLVGNPDIVLHTITAIDEGQTGALTFIRSDAFASNWATSACSAALVTDTITVENHDPDTKALIRVADADQALIRVLEAINPGNTLPPVGIHTNASIDESAAVHPQARIGPGCVVGPNASIGANAALLANIYIGANCTVGDDTILHPGVVIADRVTIGARCEFFANTVIGADGFGFIPATKDQHPIKIPQIGTVTIGDDVELGACCTIDRAKLGTTVIGNHVKMDDRVHIGHNSIIADDVVICGCTTLGGTVTIGKGTLVGGSVTIRDQITIGQFVKVAGGAMVMDTIPDDETYAGMPAMPARIALANHGAMRNLAQFMRTTKKTLKELTKEKQ